MSVVELTRLVRLLLTMPDDVLPLLVEVVRLVERSSSEQSRDEQDGEVK